MFFNNRSVGVFLFFQNRLVNIVRNRRADAAAGAAFVRRLHHHHDGILRIFIRRERGEPVIVPSEPVGAVLHLRRAGLAANAQPRSTTAALPVPSASSVSPSIASCKIRRLRGAHANVVAHPRRRKICRQPACQRILRLNPRNQARPENRSAVGNRRIGHGHLQRRHRHVTLADAEIAPCRLRASHDEPAPASANRRSFPAAAADRFVRRNEIFPPAPRSGLTPACKPTWMK